MNENALEKRQSGAIREKGQFAMAFGVIAVMLFVAGFPVFLVLFLGVLSFFIWKVFSSEGRNETRRIFEFYLSANEILRDDDRRWYGFEIQDSIDRGEAIVRAMSAPPPLVLFALGAMYQKLDDHSSAVKYLSQVVDESVPDETAIVFPTKELREYVRMLRKIERSPAEAPLTSSSIRSLERARRNRGKKLLEDSRLELTKKVSPMPHSEQRLESIVDVQDHTDNDRNKTIDNHSFDDGDDRENIDELAHNISHNGETHASVGASRHHARAAARGDRKTISEVLHDIYDKNVQ